MNAMYDDLDITVKNEMCKYIACVYKPKYLLISTV